MKVYLIFLLLILVTVALNCLAQHFWKKRWNLWLGYGGPSLVMMLFLIKASTPPRLDWFNDFLCYYPAGYLILKNPLELYSFQGIYGFVNIPIIALLFTPFTVLDKHKATIVFTILGLLTVLAAYYFIVKLTKVSDEKRIALLGLFIINGPLYNSLWYGNLTHFVLLLLLAALFCLKKQREFWLGILLAIAALIKIPLLLLGVYFAMRRRWQVIAGFGVALLVVVGASVLLFGFDLHLAWLHHIGMFSGKPVSAYGVQSVDGFLARLLLNTTGDLRNWNPIVVSWKYKTIRSVLLFILIGGTVWICWRAKEPTTLVEKNLEFAIVLTLALVISPISWIHYYLLLLLPYALYVSNQLAVPQGYLWSAGVVLSILLISPPAFTASVTNSIISVLYSRVLISHYFFGGVLLLGVLLAARWYTSQQHGRPKDTFNNHVAS